MRARNFKKAQERGAAMVEFALIIPLFITMILFSLFFTEEVRGLLKIQEASRFAAWEMTSYTLTDYGKGDSPHAFDVAKQAVEQEVTDRFKDLDSVEDNQPFTMFADFDPVKVTVENEDVPFVDKSIPNPGGILGSLGSTANWFLSQWGFNPKGKIKVTVTSAIHNKIVGKDYLDTGSGKMFNVDQYGGHSLDSFPLTNSFSLIADGWQLPDGANANATKGEAGRHGKQDGSGSDSGLYTEVNRMVFLGLKAKFQSLPIGKSLTDIIGKFVPALAGTFVVSHNYEDGDDPSCDYPGHGTPKGMNNVNNYPVLDFNAPRCFDTSPFRDTAKYDDSLYRQIYLARGNNFMGCKQAQADDPTFISDPNTTDNDKSKTNCQ